MSKDHAGERYLSCGSTCFIWELHVHPFALHKKIQCPTWHRPGWGMDLKKYLLKKKRESKRKGLNQDQATFISVMKGTCTMYWYMTKYLTKDSNIYLRNPLS